MAKVEIVKCRRCGKEGDRHGTTKDGLFAFVPYYGYDKRGNFYMCCDCSKNWLQKEIYPRRSDKEMRKFIDYVEGEGASDRFFCRECGRFLGEYGV